MKRDRAMEELRALVLENKPHLTSTELETSVDSDCFKLGRASKNTP